MTLPAAANQAGLNAVRRSHAAAKSYLRALPQATATSTGRLAAMATAAALGTWSSAKAPRDRLPSSSRLRLVSLLVASLLCQGDILSAGAGAALAIFVELSAEAAAACKLQLPLPLPLPGLLLALRPLVLVKRLMQRRYLYAQMFCTCWDDCVATLLDKVASFPLLALGPAVTLHAGRRRGGACGLQDLHRVRGTDVLFSPEVATCRFPPDVCEHSQRLLLDRWALAECPCEALAAIPE